MPGLPRQLLSSNLSILTEALTPDVNLVVWQRALPVHIATFAETVLATGQPLAESRVLDLVDDEPPVLTDLAAAFSDVEGHTSFVADVTWLVHAYGCLTGARRVGLRIRTLNKAMCPRYHVDWVSLRLITTYAGAGSEWLPEGAVPRDLLGTPSAKPSMPPEKVDPGSVALFKGERWDGNEGRGIVHRSPPASAHEGRMIMTLDWLN